MAVGSKENSAIMMASSTPMGGVQRDSRFELLRIFSMFLIVGYHCVCFGAGNAGEMIHTSVSMNQFLALSLGGWGQLGVSIFVIISCWFLADREPSWQFKHILKLILQVWSTCLIIDLIAVITRPGVPDFEKLLLKNLITPFYSQYWFVATYILFICVMPFLQLSLKNITESQLRGLLAITTFLIPFYNMCWYNLGSHLADFCYLFYLTAYLKRHENNFIERHRVPGAVLMYVGIVVICELFFLLADRTGYEVFATLTDHIYNRENIPIYFLAFCIFYIFRHLEIGSSKVINIFASATLGVYIIHENDVFHGRFGEIPSILWDGFFHMDAWYRSKWFGLYLLFVTGLVFASCTILELVRKKLIDELLLEDTLHLPERINRALKKVFQLVDK